MAVKPPEQTQRVARNVTPMNRAHRMYYVEAEMLVPHRFLVAVPAASADAACRLSADVIKRGFAYGIPDFDEAKALTVSSIRSGEPNGDAYADRVEPIPAEHRRVTRNI